MGNPIAQQKIMLEEEMNIYVGNLSWETTEEDLRKAFEEFGQVESTRIITDRFSGRSRGFAFIEMPTQTEGEAAIAGLNGKELKSREITVNEARPRSEDRGDKGRRSW